MDGDSETEHRSGAFCSSPNSHAFSSDEGSHRPIVVPKNSSEKKTKLNKTNRALLDVGFSPVRAMLTLRPFSVSFSLSDFTHTELLWSRGASLGCWSPHTSRRWKPGNEVVSARAGIRVFHFGQVGEAVARLREMCVGMAIVGQTHRGGGWWGSGGLLRFKADRRGTTVPVYIFKKIIARISDRFI